MKIYFAGSIRGGREDASLYNSVIQHLSQYGTVLTEHVGLESLKSDGEISKEAYIYNRDMDWLRSCDVVVAEVTQPSLGVGYEIAMAETLQKRVLCLFRPKERSLSAMIRGNSKMNIVDYNNLEEACGAIDHYFALMATEADWAKEREEGLERDYFQLLSKYSE